MKRKTAALILGASLMVSGMSMNPVTAETAAPAGTEAEAGTQAAPAENDAETAAGAEAGAAQTAENGPDVTLSIGSASLTIKNGTPHTFAKCEYRPVADGADLILTDETGKETVFEKAEPEKWTEPQIIAKFGFVYIEYKNEAGEVLLASPKGDEIVFEQSMSAYPIEEVNVRADASEEAQVLKTAIPGEEWKATASRPGWVKIELDGVIGYAVCGYLTESKDAAEKAAGIVINSAAASVTPSATPTPAVAQTAASGQQSSSSSTSSYSGNSYYEDSSDYSDYSDYDYSEDYSWSEPDYSDDSGSTGGGETGGGETGGGETGGGETGGGETGGGETGGGETGGGETGGGETGGGETGGGETGGESTGE